jgi:hypothetical protein
MLDVAVTEIGLQRSGIDALVGQMESTSVAEHMRVNRETELGRRA